MIIKTTDWSQAERGGAEGGGGEILHLLDTNLHQPALTQYKGHVGSCFQDSEVQIPETPAVLDQCWLCPCREGCGMDTKIQGRKAPFQGTSVNPSVLSQLHQQVWVWAGPWMMGLMLQGAQEMGRNEGMRLFCLPCNAILGSSPGCESHHSNPWLPTPSFHLPLQNILLAL